MTDKTYNQDQPKPGSICYGCDKHDTQYPGCVCTCPAWDKPIKPRP